MKNFIKLIMFSKDMWECENGHKNSNSNKKCHGSGCNEIKPVIKKKGGPKIVRDFCPKCQKHQDFKKTSKGWSCSGCHRKFKMTGKPVPETLKINQELEA